MTSRGYARFTDDDYDDADGDDRHGEARSQPSPPVILPEYEDVDLGLSGADSNDVQIENGGEVAPPRSNDQIGLAEMGVEADEGGRGREGGGGGTSDLETETRSRRWSMGAFYHWLMSNAVLLYISQALSAWGDRMWTFAVSLYLVEIEDQSLRLTAVYGLGVSASALLFGAAVGKWVDKTPRLRAVRTALVIQNSSVIINACILCTVLVLKDEILPIWNGALYIICQLVIIFLGMISSLASLAEKICIQKDWIIVVAGNDVDVLAIMNANMRRIDLIVNILAPIAVGAIMSSSMLVGGIFIAGWNAVSLIVEYWNIHRVYKNVPQLAVKGGVAFTDESLHDVEDSDRYSEMREPGPSEGRDDNLTPARSKDGTQESYEEQVTVLAPIPPPSAPTSSGSKRRCGGCLDRVLSRLKEMFEGWKVYKSYQEVWAGLGLAFIYMTVMGFDSITNGYGYSQGVPNWAIGVLQGLGSISGILGTILYPFMRRHVGLERSGLYSLAIQVTFLMLCLASVWAPGSPFIVDYSSETVPTTGSIASSSFPSSVTNWPVTMTTTIPASNATGLQCKYTEEYQSSFVSVGLFFAGMVLSRIGLWAFDLTVTQIFQENVRETERGVFNGVQRAMECTFDMIHFILVIILPCPETFGILIILSWAFVVMGAMNYTVYSYKKRGHLLHTDKIVPCMKNGHV